MAGRKPPSEPNFFSTLLGKLGLERTPPPPTKKGTAGGKRRRKRPAAAEGGDAGYAPPDAFAPDDGGPSPFADYGAAGGLMDQPGEPDFADALTYEAAAAAGYAPPPARAEAAPAPALPRFGGEPAPPPAAPAAEGKLFSQDALDNSLDALFSGLETGMAPPPIPPLEPTAVPPAPAPAPAAPETSLFDEFGLTPASPVADEAVPEAAAPPPAPAAAPAHRPIHKPIVAETPPPAPPDPAEPPRPRTPTGPTLIDEVERQPSVSTGSADFRLPSPTVLELASGVNLNAFLATVDRTAGVAGSLIVGYDGLIIASSLPSEIDPDYLGAQATNLFMGNRGQLEKMRRGELRRIILETASGAMLVTAADMGILVVVSHEGRAMDIGGVMAAIGGALGHA
jgi:predicted regulator of Ras-like GTPase activity (Roadblock/LC7/MglB family)